MSQATPRPFEVERHGQIAIVILAPEVERMTEAMIEAAAKPALDALRQAPVAGLIIDLAGVPWVGSFLLGTLFRFYKRVAEQLGKGGAVADASLRARFAVAAPSARVRELMDMTCLNAIWSLFNNRKEAITALEGDLGGGAAGAK